MNSLRFLLSALAASLAIVAPASAATQVREATGFDSISLAAPIRVDLVLGDRESVVLEGDEEALAVIEVAVEGSSLRLRSKREARLFTWNIGGKDRVVAKVTAKRISALSIHGSGDIRAPQLSADSLAITIAGSGDVSIDGGKAGDLALRISGSGDVRVGKLEAQRAVVSIAGSGDVTLWARESLTVKVAGSGDVRYYGDPKLTKSVAGSGDIKRLGAAPA